MHTNGCVSFTHRSTALRRNEGILHTCGRSAGTYCLSPDSVRFRMYRARHGSQACAGPPNPSPSSRGSIVKTTRKTQIVAKALLAAALAAGASAGFSAQQEARALRVTATIQG